MTKRLTLLVLALLLAVPAQADFADIARALDRELGSRTWIPFLGLGRVLVRAVRPNGVHDFQLAVFERTRQSPDPQALERIVARGVEKGFAPLVRVRSNRQGEAVFIWARPNRRCIELIILAHERDETVLVRVDADAEKVAREFGEPRGMVRLANR
jgi:hypothetical protein